MDDEKKIWQSKTFWGALVAGVVALGGVFGFDLPQGGEGLADEIVIMIGSVVAIIGRFTAKATVTL